MAGRVIPFPSRAPEPPEPENERGFEELTRVGDQAEALVVRGLLEAHGIEVLLRSHVAPSVYPFSVGEQGAVQVLVRREALGDEPPPPRPSQPGSVVSLTAPDRAAQPGAASRVRTSTSSACSTAASIGSSSVSGRSWAVW